MKQNIRDKTEQRDGGLEPGTSGLPDQWPKPLGDAVPLQSPQNIRSSNMNTNGWSAACDGGGGKTCGLLALCPTSKALKLVLPTHGC